MEEAYVVVAFRSPVGKFMGKLSDLSAVQIATEVAKGTFERSGVDSKLIEEAIIGNVLSAGEGQNPAKQVVMHSGMQKNVATVNVNMICASGLKAIALAAQGIRANDLNLALAGGMIPSLASGCPKMESVDAILRSHAIASSLPPPRQ